MKSPSDKILRRRYRLKGVVQGVGMRPFIHGLAHKLGLTGRVYNDGRGVVIEAQGTRTQLHQFALRLRRELPPAARLDEMLVRNIRVTDERDFTISVSPPGGVKFTRISPDLATCPDCLREMNDPADRRYHYPFINCTHCGPRLTIIRDIPYDRPRTTMSGFRMCPDCRREYDDPRDRRFHAQPNACPVCGPRLYLRPEPGTVPSSNTSDDRIARVVQLLRQGGIVAVKGIGGVHLACDASNDAAVGRLRSRKIREEKPFALMVRDLRRVRELAEVNRMEADLLTSTARPIVVLDRKPGVAVSRQVSPELNTLGLMIPYTPLHELLMQACGLDLVMTSGNLAEEPIAFRDDEILPRLEGVADLFLLHDRPIHLRADDSVVRVIRGRRITLRRSRGYVPDPVSLPYPLRRPILACGAELKNVFCVGRDDQLILSHHIGDLENLSALEAFEDGVEHFKKLFSVEPQRVACDLHPDYLSTQYAQKTGLPLLEVQHHHAHVLACQAEKGDFAPTLAWTLDGIGLGEDQALWGGECLRVNGLRKQVLARIRPIPLPGGEKAIREPWRIAAAALLSESPRDGMHMIKQVFPGRPAEFIAQMLERRVQCPLSSGAGRLFDAIAALAGIRQEIAYEGQAAILLEAQAQQEIPQLLESMDGLEAYTFRIQETPEQLYLNWGRLIAEVLDDLRTGANPGVIGGKFHVGFIRALRETSEILRRKTGIKRIILTGGVFQNRILLTNLWRELEEAGFEVSVPSDIPLNDGGIALGQAAALWLHSAISTASGPT
jgi:hydrogenase maturation protein HypF